MTDTEHADEQFEKMPLQVGDILVIAVYRKPSAKQ